MNAVITEAQVREALEINDQAMVGIRRGPDGRRYYDDKQEQADKVTLSLGEHLIYPGIRGHVMHRMRLDVTDKEQQRVFNAVFNRITGYQPKEGDDVK